MPFVWDASDALVVSADDEEAVEKILDAIEYPDALEAVVEDEGGDDDEAAQDTLSELFLAVRSVDARSRLTKTARTV